MTHTSLRHSYDRVFDLKFESKIDCQIINIDKEKEVVDFQQFLSLTFQSRDNFKKTHWRNHSSPFFVIKEIETNSKRKRVFEQDTFHIHKKRREQIEEQLVASESVGLITEPSQIPDSWEELVEEQPVAPESVDIITEPSQIPDSWEELVEEQVVAPDIVELIPTFSDFLPAGTSEVNEILSSLTSLASRSKSALKRSHRRAKLKERQSEKKLQKEKEVEAQLLHQIEQEQKKFKLHLISDDKTAKMNGLTSREDQTGFPQDFRKAFYLPEKIGQAHVWKRLNYFRVMCGYIQEKSPYLQNATIPTHEKDQYTATLYVTPPSFAKKRDGYEHYERTHISLLNKISIIFEGTLQRMDGPLEVKGIKTDVHSFFNGCDIAPRTVNLIDGFAELNVRVTANRILNAIKAGELSVPDAASSLAREYEFCLIELQDRVIKRITQPPKSCRFPYEFSQMMQEIIEDKSSLRYIVGMLASVTDFQKRASSGASEALYEQIA